MMELQPIETAPKDGTAILLYVPDEVSGDGYGTAPDAARHFVVGWWGNSSHDYRGKEAWVCSLTESELFQGSEYTGSWTEYEWVQVKPTHWAALPAKVEG